MLVSEFDFNLPENLIAQQPFFPREETKMVVCDGAKILDRQFIDLLSFLQEGDVLVFNDVRVIKAKLVARVVKNIADSGLQSSSGARFVAQGEVEKNIEFNLDQEIAPKIWRVLVRGIKKINDGDYLEIAPDFFAQVEKKLEDGFALVKFLDDYYLQRLDKYGAVPLPPYIKRDAKNVDEQDKINYQTIYANDGNAVAAPTAGLHFTKKMFDLLDARGIKKVFVTLNVGAGTFLPVRSETLQEHKMHEESFTISAEAAEIINQARVRGGRIVAVGTTSLRVLESVADAAGKLCEAKTTTKIFIYPPYRFKVVDVLLTNFHLPKSTLFMLVSAFVGKEKAKEIYSHAVARQYRFYSYGDASLLIRQK